MNAMARLPSLKQRAAWRTNETDRDGGGGSIALARAGEIWILKQQEQRQENSNNNDSNNNHNSTVEMSRHLRNKRRNMLVEENTET